MLCVTCGIDTAPDWNTCPVCGARGAGIPAAPAASLPEPVRATAPARHHRVDPLLRFATTAVVAPPTCWMLWTLLGSDFYTRGIPNPFRVIWPSLPMLAALLTCAFLMLLPRFTVTVAAIIIAVMLPGMLPVPAYRYIQEFLNMTINASAQPIKIYAMDITAVVISVVAVALCMVLLRRARVLGAWGGTGWVAVITYTVLILADLAAFMWDFDCLDSERNPSFFCPMFRAGEQKWQDWEVLSFCATLAILVWAARTTADQVAVGLILGIAVDQTSDVVLWSVLASDPPASVFDFSERANFWSSLVVVAVLTALALLRLRRARRPKTAAESDPEQAKVEAPQ